MVQSVLTRRLGRVGLVGAIILLSMDSEAQAQWRWFCRPRPECPQDYRAPVEMPKDILPKDGKETAPKDVSEPTLPPLTTVALADTTTSVPQIMGDFFGYCGQRFVTVPITRVVTQTVIIPQTPPLLPITQTIQTLVPGTQQVLVCDPIASRAGSGFKVADNESPRPVDRAFFTYNYFNNIQSNGGFSPASTTQLQGITIATPGVAVAGSNLNVHRELFGFEKTLFGGDASVELRLPVFQSQGGGGTADGFAGDDFGDLTVVMKYALLNDRNSGNVFSVGLAVTAPTGPAINTFEGNINSVLLQPFFGYIWRGGDFYFQGIHSIVFPTNASDVTLFFNDLDVGYVFTTRSNPYLAFVAPNFEAHVSTPLNHRNAGGAVFASDVVSLTGGVHLGLGSGRSVLSLGVATPITGPRPYDVEAFVQFNFRF
ncbi:MAG: hypothetical protein HY040_11485 [Planctomycetes bacterium]|nr:hypothetical protein [Planctomycetota bacterium]